MRYNDSNCIFVIIRENPKNALLLYHEAKLLSMPNFLLFWQVRYGSGCFTPTLTGQTRPFSHKFLRLSRREKYSYKVLVILLLDGCSSHFSDYFLDECTFNNVFHFPNLLEVQTMSRGLIREYLDAKKPNLNQNDNIIREIINS